MGKISDRILGRQTENKRAPTRGEYPGGGYQSVAPAGGMPTLPPPRAYRPRLEEWEVSNPYGKHKFIIVDHPQIGEVALCFPGYLVHADMASRIFTGLKVVSAGFYTIFDRDDIKTNGKSESLGVPSRQDPAGKKKDEELIAMSLGLV